MARNENIEKLHSVYNDLAPDAKAQEGMVEARNDMHVEGCSDEQILIMITGAIYDGLVYGNWINFQH